MENIISLIIYLIIFLLSSYLLNNDYTYNTDNRKKESLYIRQKDISESMYSNIIAFSILILLAAGRYKVGTDFWQYEKNFQQYASEPITQFIASLRINNEPLFAIITRYTYKIGGRVLTWGVIAFLILYIIYYQLNNNYPELSHGTAIAVFLLTGYADSFNLAKEYIAISLAFLSINYIFENNFRKFMICIIAATLFHSTAILMVICWLLWDHRNEMSITGLRMITVIIVTITLVYFYQPLIRAVSSYVPFFSNYSDYANEITSRNREFYVALLILAVVLVFHNTVNEMDNRANFFLLLYMISVIIGLTGFWHPQVKRMGLYFSIPSTIYYAGTIPKCVKQEQEIVASGIIITFYVMLFVLVYYILGQSHLIPYHFDLVSPVF